MELGSPPDWVRLVLEVSDSLTFTCNLIVVDLHSHVGVMSAPLLSGT